MFFDAKIIFLTILAVTNGNKEKIDEIASSIGDTGKVLQRTKTMITFSSVDFKAALETLQSFADLGAQFFPGLKIFSSSIGLLSGLLNEKDTKFDKIIEKLTEIKASIQHLETMVSNLAPQIRKDMIKQRFIQNIQHKINDMQRLYNDFAQRPTLPQKQALTEQCRGNNMQNVLTEIHNELVNGGEGYYSELLEGGERREMTDAEKWAKAFQGLHMQATFLLSVCFPLLQTEPGWEDDLSFQMDNHQKDFEQINVAIKRQLTALKNSFAANGKAALPQYLNLPDNWDDNQTKRVEFSYNYLNNNFNPGEGLKWNVISIRDDHISYISPELFRFVKNNWALIFQYGKLSTRIRGTECYDLLHINCKLFESQKIGGHRVNYLYHDFGSDYTSDYFVEDSGKFDGYDQNGWVNIIQVTTL